ncbi:MAG: 50S ribosomal protein L32 [Chloroflexi bacterium]|nr:50S ribosomal protein L32 [Chloroflexota bacterium]MAZ64269.1 50S ribosomal protein L32 [Dehalococcoidia bacterium]MCH2506059.1 50S ribosomal protein L32 [Dehalococcoidia bacterium]MEC9286785.1 50S ribosomal protein L32 [Chloroflexota bacterium]MED5568534.1 50S ribosomal protein L32 [Chloroflexota bacterium]
MGAVPNKKITRAQRGRRFTSQKLKPLNPSVCTRCRSAKMPHTVCPQCGFYKGRQMVGTEG